jgi:hypothetical protein
MSEGSFGASETCSGGDRQHCFIAYILGGNADGLKQRSAGSGQPTIQIRSNVMGCKPLIRRPRWEKPRLLHTESHVPDITPNRHVCSADSIELRASAAPPSLFPPFPSPATMTSRIHIARPQQPGYASPSFAQQSFAPDPNGLGNSRPSSTGYRAANPDDPLEKLRAFAKQVEDAVEIQTQPLKPHLPAIGRFLIIITFLEDALRILTQWGDQVWYLSR